MADKKKGVTVRMLSAMVGDCFHYAHGDVVEVPDQKTADRWIERGAAEACPQDLTPKHTYDPELVMPTPDDSDRGPTMPRAATGGKADRKRS